MPGRVRRRSLALLAVVSAALSALTGIVYRNVGDYAFVFDDGGFILTNTPLLGGLSWESVRWAFTTTYTANWHPLSWLSHLLDVTLFGLNPGPPHVVNLTLLPMTPADHAVLEQALAPGPVTVVTRGFGSCAITSTRLRNVWRLRHFNSMKTVILNTLIVAGVPEEAMAAREDLEDSRERLAELIAWMSESCPG